MKQKTLPQLKKQALELFTKLSKLQYHSEGKLRCYTCGKPLELNTNDCQLGHYLSRGAYPCLTLHPNNSRPQCIRCNVWLHGNTIEFREKLIKEIGETEVLKLESQRHNEKKWSRSELLDLIEEYKRKIKELCD